MTRSHLIGMTLWRMPLGILGGLLSSLALPRENIWPLIFVAVGAILVSIRGLRFWSAALIGFGAGLSWYLSQIEWMSLYLGPVPWIALSVLEAGIFAIGSGALALVWKAMEKLPKSWYREALIALAIAVMWSGREWVAINLPYGGFPWSRVAQALSESFMAKLVYFVGISGLTLIAVFLTVVALRLAESGFKTLKEQLLPLTATVAIFLVAIFFPIPTGPERGEITVAAVQGNANAGLFSNSDRGTFLKNHAEATLLLDNHPLRDLIDVVVWPENASDINPQRDPFAKLIIDSIINKYQSPMILGAITESGGEIFNSSLYYSAQGEELDQYDKKRPVPFAEYVPDRDFWYQLAPDLIGLVSRGYAFGTRDGIFELEGNSLGVLICFEIAIDDIGRELVGDGAEIILSQTNNADFGRSDETFQQAALAKLRAIETGRALVNISTVGVSRVFLPDGSVIDELPIYTPGVMVQTLPLRNSITPAMFIGSGMDLAVNFSALALLIWAIGIRLLRISRKREK